MLAYGIAGDFMDEYVRIGESTTVFKYEKVFLKAVINSFGEEYLHKPNSEDITRLIAIGEHCGFPGMLGSIDCSHNDINNLERSSVFSQLAAGCTLLLNFSVNGHTYTMGYYLADGIYPSWATFEKSIPLPQTNKARHFAMCQEAARKGVEQAFGVLQDRSTIVRGPTLYFHIETLTGVMMGCIILHKMTVEDERHLHMTDDISSICEQIKDSPPTPQISHERTPEFEEFLKIHRSI